MASPMLPIANVASPINNLHGHLLSECNSESDPVEAMKMALLPATRDAIGVPKFHKRLACITFSYATMWLMMVLFDCTQSVAATVACAVPVALFSVPVSLWYLYKICTGKPLHDAEKHRLEVLNWIYPCEILDGGIHNVNHANLPTFPTILRNEVQLTFFATAVAVPFTSLAFAAQWVPKRNVSLDPTAANSTTIFDGPIMAETNPAMPLVRAAFGVYMLGIAVLCGIGLPWSPSVADVALVRRKEAELAEASPLVRKLRGSALLFARYKFQESRDYGTLAFFLRTIVVPVCTALAFAALHCVLLLDGTTHSITHVIFSPAHVFSVIFFLWTVIMIMIPVQWLIGPEFLRLVQESCKRVDFFQQLLHGSRLEALLRIDEPTEDAIAAAIVTCKCGEPMTMLNKGAPPNAATGRRADLMDDAAEHHEFCTAMHAWLVARAFVLEVDCNLVLSSTSPFVGVILLISTFLLVVISVIALSTVSAHPLLPGTQGIFGLAVACLWATSSSYLTAKVLLYVYSDTKKTVLSLQRLSLQAIHGCVGGHERAMHMSLLMRELTSAVERDSKTPVVLGMNVKPTLITTINSTVAAATTSFVVKGVSMWMAPK